MVLNLLFFFEFFLFAYKISVFWSSQEALCKMEAISFSSVLNNVELASLKYFSM